MRASCHGKSYNVALMFDECSEILSGSVFLFHNAYLCFDDTVQWRDILSGEGAEVVAERRRLLTCELGFVLICFSL